MAYETFNYDFLNVYSSTQSPSTAHAHNNDMSRFFMRYLFQKATSVLKFKLPINFDISYFLYTLYGQGYVGIVKTDNYGVVPQAGTVGGDLNLYWNPKHFYPIVSNDNNIRQDYNIHYGYGENITKSDKCCIIRLTPDFKGIGDIVALYADTMAIMWENLGLNAINSKLAYVFLTKNKTFAESIKKMYDNVQRGDPMVVIDKSLLDEEGRSTWDVFTQDLKTNFIAPDILNVLEKLENDFDKEIGIPNAGGNSKRAQLTNDEVSINNVSTYSKCELWLEQIERDIDVVNEYFKNELLEPISVTMRYNRDSEYNTFEGGETYGN